jgi:signal transduction histidine kinase
MIIGEGGVFILILMAGFWKIQQSIAKEIQLSQRQNNFMLSVTHELKTPLTSIQLALQTLKKPNLKTEDQADLIAKALGANQRLSSLIDNIINASRLESNDFTPRREIFPLKTFLQNKTAELTASHEQASIKLNCEVDIIHADAYMLETIFNNLLENAIKYSGENPKMEIIVKQNEKFIEIIVSDQGTGMTTEEKQQIFKKFYRVGNEISRSQKGSGLGLFITSEFVQLHKGRIKCENNKPAGTKFIIELPNGE